MKTERARKFPAFVSSLGHFEWRRMPFGLKNAPMIYQRMMDNDLWDPKVVQKSNLSVCDPQKKTQNALRQGGRVRSRFNFEADRKSASILDPVSELVNGPMGDMFSNGKPDESSLVLVFDRRSFVDDICFGIETFDGCLSTLDRLPQRFTECRTRVSFTKRLLVQSRVDFLSHKGVPEGLREND
ncbi:LOW QUALITY PROTEIN: hypothetical protein PHMEG_0003907 [Phytophthora megakarya]|uniref:Reverse transcriptase n=1 Tax=Phytophthora megakarya TaxID=4795 RepID=A0A225WV84_9STRA|nr:LOW QUALITY PROTEIN: hypothetical protein PHMEG_0003907 [Phytophthora megakarya]